MTDRRILFHKLLCEILSCPIEGEQCRCYFQPPESIKMNYPAIVYSLDDIDLGNRITYRKPRIQCAGFLFI